MSCQSNDILTAATTWFIHKEKTMNMSNIYYKNYYNLMLPDSPRALDLLQCLTEFIKILFSYRTVIHSESKFLKKADSWASKITTTNIHLRAHYWPTVPSSLCVAWQPFYTAELSLYCFAYILGYYLLSINIFLCSVCLFNETLACIYIFEGRAIGYVKWYFEKLL